MQASVVHLARIRLHCCSMIVVHICCRYLKYHPVVLCRCNQILHQVQHIAHIIAALSLLTCLPVSILSQKLVALCCQQGYTGCTSGRNRLCQMRPPSLTCTRRLLNGLYCLLPDLFYLASECYPGCHAILAKFLQVGRL